MSSEGQRSQVFRICDLEGGLEETDSTEYWEAVEFPFMFEVDSTCGWIFWGISDDLVLSVGDDLNLSLLPKNSEVERASILHKSGYGLVLRGSVLMTDPEIHREYGVERNRRNSDLGAWFEPKSHAAHSGWIFGVLWILGPQIAHLRATYCISYVLIFSEHWDIIEKGVAILHSVVERRTAKTYNLRMESWMAERWVLHIDVSINGFKSL